ncbi:MAG: type VII secretion protein EccC, partial [Actinomycetota bacterium]|nr:type VII secretion protein EccC [Actinomycetota bacterium]
MSATPTAVQREGRIEPPPMPYGELDLQPPPPLFAGEGAASNALMTAVPLLGSVGSVAFVAMSGKSAQSYLAAGMFMIASLGFVGVSIWRTRTSKTAQVTSNRREYLSYLRGIREVARKAGAEQRRHLTWIHPDPVALASVAEEGTRVWERSTDDEDWLLVRYASGPQRLALDLRPPESDTIDKLDPVS